jgi:ATP-dependent helicase HrpA
MTRDALMRHAAREVTEAQYPETLPMAGSALPLKYRFAPGHPRDGLTLTVPLALLNQIDGDRLTWLVPGMIREKVTAHLKVLPKPLRNRLVPLPDSVTAFLDAVAYGKSSLTDALRDWISRRIGEPMPLSVFDAVELPTHLRVNVRVVDAAGKELGEDRDLAALRAKLGQAAQLTFAQQAPSLERSGLRQWDFGDLPETLTRAERGARITGYPGLADDGDSVSIVLLDTREAAAASHRTGVVRLIRIALKDALARIEGRGGPAGFAQSALLLKPAIATDALLADVVDAVCDRAFVGDDPLPRTQSAFAEQVKRARARLPAVADSAFRLLAEIAGEYHAVSQRIAALPASQSRLAAEVRARRDALIRRGFFSATPWTPLTQIPRYLRALDRRIAKQRANPARDAKHAAQLADWWRRYDERVERARLAGRSDARLAEFRWLLEELAVSLFAQELRTPFPVSYKRLERAWADLDR